MPTDLVGEVRSDARESPPSLRAHRGQGHAATRGSRRRPDGACEKSGEHPRILDLTCLCKVSDSEVYLKTMWQSFKPGQGPSGARILTEKSSGLLRSILLLLALLVSLLPSSKAIAMRGISLFFCSLFLALSFLAIFLLHYDSR